MKPSDISKLPGSHRRVAYRYVLGWWPDRDEFVPPGTDVWWNHLKGRERFGGART